MKKTLLLLSILSLFVLSSCGDDDAGNTVGLSGSVTYDGEEYAIANGIFNLSEDDGDALGRFFLADGTLELSSPTQVTTSDSEIIIVMSAVSKGTSNLANGDYATSTNVPDLYVDIAVTTFDGENEIRRDAFTNGTVAISGSGSTYTLTFNASFGSGITLTGSVNGTFADS